MMPSAVPGRFTLREILNLFFKDSRVILITFLCPFVLACIAALMVHPKYQAEATLLVKIGREYLYRPEIGEANSMPPISFDREQMANAEASIIGSHDLLLQTINRVGLENMYPAIARQKENPAEPRVELAVREFGRALDASVVKDSSVIVVTMTHKNRVIAARAINTLIDAYLAKRREIYSSSKVRFFESQAALFKTNLENTEQQISTFKKQNGIYSYEEQKSLLLGQLNQIEQRLKEVSTDISDRQGRMAALERQMPRINKDVQIYSEAGRDETVDNAKKTLLDLKLKERLAESTYAENSPVVQDIRADILRTQAYIKEQESRQVNTVRSGRSPIRDSVETDLAHLQADEHGAQSSRTTLQQQREMVLKQIQRLSEQEILLDDLMRQRQLMEDSYQTYAKKLDEARITDELDHKEKTSVAILQAAVPPIEKKSVSMLIFVVGMVFSAMMAVFVAFIRELFRDTYVSPEQLERSLGMPVLSSIPEHG